MTNFWENHNIDISTLPNLVPQAFARLEKKYRWVLLLQTVLFFTILIIGLSIASFFIEQEWPQLYFNVGYISFLFLLCFSSFWLWIAFPQKAFLLREHDISYKSGLVIKKQTSVPKNRIQHVEIRQGVFLRLFGLAKIVIYTAGGSGSDLSISGLKPEVAEQIKEDLSQSISEEQHNHSEAL